MGDVAQLLAEFEAGRLVRPSADRTNFVDVARAVAHVCGVDEMRLNDHSRAIAEHLRRADHLVFLLVDGLGINFVDAMPRGSWLRRHTLRTILAPFPSTTPVAVTALATGCDATSHAITGWWTHVPAMGEASTVFQHDRARDGLELGRLGFAVRDLLTGTPIIPRMRRDAALVMPSGITESTYTKWMAGDATRLGYNRLPKAVEIIASRIADAEGPTFTYWYVPVVDTLAHALGVSAARVAAAAIEVDTAVAALTERLAAARGGLRIVATADHGHLDINPHLEVGAADPLLELLSAPPSGDTRTQFWHVDPERRPEFEAAFRHRFGDHFLLLETAEVEALRLLGPDTLSPDVRARLGDYMTLARAAATLRFEGYPGHEHYREMRSAHSGLTPAEMLVPLIVAGSGDPPDGMYR